MMATSDVSFTCIIFQTYRSFKWTKDLTLTKKIQIFSELLIILACNVFKVEYIIADFKADFMLNPKIMLIFSNQIKFSRNKLLLEMYRTVFTERSHCAIVS